MLASHRHGQLLGGSTVEKHLSDAAEQQAVAVAGATDMYLAGQNTVVSGSADQAKHIVGVLASWKNVAIEHMAHMLLHMTPRQRTEIRQECAQQLS